MTIYENMVETIKTLKAKQEAIGELLNEVEPIFFSEHVRIIQRKFDSITEQIKLLEDIKFESDWEEDNKKFESEKSNDSEILMKESYIIKDDYLYYLPANEIVCYVPKHLFEGDKINFINRQILIHQTRFNHEEK